MSDVKPWRISIPPRPYAVVELNAVGVHRSELEVGDRLLLNESTLRA